jgi:hypothetical protein
MTAIKRLYVVLFQQDSIATLAGLPSFEEEEPSITGKQRYLEPK